MHQNNFFEPIHSMHLKACNSLQVPLELVVSVGTGGKKYKTLQLLIASIFAKSHVWHDLLR